MKIAVWHNLPSGGGKRALYYHVKGLLERGHTVEAWCPPTADQTYLPLSEFVHEHIVPFEWTPLAANMPLARFSKSYHNIISKLRAMDRHCQQCAEEINHGDFDLVFANACIFFRVTSIGRFVKCPKLIYLQEPYRPLYEALPILPWAALPSSGRWYSPKYVKKYIGDFIRVQALRVQVREEVLNARTFDTILVNSFFSRESILRAYGLDARVCYLGVDTDMFVDKNQLRENFVVGVGSFDGSKNIEFIIKALSLLPEPRPALVWVGDRGNASIINPLRQLANSMDVSFEPRVRISDVELVAILNRARLMAYAPRLEPFGYAPLEANACGLPVVAVAEGGVRETVIDGVNGLLVEHSHQAMADAIRRLLDDKEYAQMLGKSGRRLVEQKWQVAASVDRLEQRILEVLENVSNH